MYVIIINLTSNLNYNIFFIYMFLKLKKQSIYLVLLILGNFAIYSISVNYKIFRAWDDQLYILNNTSHLSFSISNIYYWITHPCVGCYLPLTMFSYMFDYNLFGLNSFYFHGQNIFWHTIAVIAIFQIFIKLKINESTALLFCLIFAVHPQRVESVVWLSERKDVLCTAFYFWSIFFYITDRRKTSLFLFILSILSKPMAVSLPVVILLYEVYRDNRTGFRHLVQRLWSFFITLVLFIPISFLAQGGAVNQEVPMFERILIVFNNVFWYVKQTFLPQGLNPIYPPFFYYNQSIYLFIVFCIIAVVICIILYFKYKHKFILILLGYLLTLAPVSGFIKLGFTDHADRYSYIPSFFIFLGLALIVSQFISEHKLRKLFISGFLIIVFIFFAYKNIEYQRSWENLNVLTQKACSYQTVSPLALKMLADDELNKKDFKEVNFIANRFLKINQTYSFNPHSFYNYTNSIYLKMKIAFEYDKYSQALYYFSLIQNKMNTKDPWYKDYLLTGIQCSYLLKRNSDAVKLIDKVLKIKNLNNYEKLYYSGIKEMFLQNDQKALKHFEEALKIHPDDINLIKNIQKIKG